MDINVLTQRIIEVSMYEKDLPEETAQQVAFHMTDWLGDLKEYFDFCLHPEIYDNEELKNLLLRFLCHVPNHVAAASKLYADMAVTDIFNVGATTRSEE